MSPWSLLVSRNFFDGCEATSMNRHRTSYRITPSISNAAMIVRPPDPFPTGRLGGSLETHYYNETWGAAGKMSASSADVHVTCLAPFGNITNYSVNFPHKSIETPRVSTWRYSFKAKQPRVVIENERFPRHQVFLAQALKH